MLNCKINCTACKVEALGEGAASRGNRTVETLSSSRQAVNVWEICSMTTLDEVAKKQDDKKFRINHLVGTFIAGTLRKHRCNQQ